MWKVKLCSEALISAWVSFMCRKSTTQDPQLYFPSKESLTQDFYALKKSIDSGWVWTHEPRIQYDNHGTTGGRLEPGPAAWENWSHSIFSPMCTFCSHTFHFMRFTAGYTKCDHICNEDIMKKLQVQPMGGSPGGLSEELVTLEKRKKGWRMNCDVGEATEGLENELCCR